MSRSPNVAQIIYDLDYWLAVQVLQHKLSVEERKELARELREYLGPVPEAAKLPSEDDCTVGAGVPSRSYTREVAAASIVVHLLDQSDQPYGSERRCCNRCGVMLWPEQQAKLGTPMPIYVDNVNDYNAAPYNCSKVKL